MQADTTASGDGDFSVVEGIAELRQTTIGTGGRSIEVGGALHGESFMGALCVELFQEGRT